MLSFTSHKLGSNSLFRCTGRFVLGDEERLREAVLNQSRARAVILDLAEIQDVDAAGVGMLVSLHLWAQSNRIVFKLMNLTPRVENVLELTKLKAAFDICSVSEMLDLLCAAIRQDRSAPPARIDVPELPTAYAAAANRTV